MKIEKILVATDFSPMSQAALDAAKDLAASLGASLHVVYVEDDPILNAETTDQSYRDEFIAKISSKFEGLLNADEQNRLRAEFVVLEGNAPLEIVEFAQEAGMDLIVVGTHGRSALSHILLGSVAESVVRTAKCPVLTVRHPDHQYVAP